MLGYCQSAALATGTAPTDPWTDHQRQTARRPYKIIQAGLEITSGKGHA